MKGAKTGTIHCGVAPESPGAAIVEIGSDRFRLKPGDSVLAPREVPHAWAFVGDTPGRLLIAFAPANKMEAFFRDNAKRRKDGENVNDAEVYRAYGLELLGPPLLVALDDECVESSPARVVHCDAA